MSRRLVYYGVVNAFPRREKIKFARWIVLVVVAVAVSLMISVTVLILFVLSDMSSTRAFETEKSSYWV